MHGRDTDSIKERLHYQYRHNNSQSRLKNNQQLHAMYYRILAQRPGKRGCIILTKRPGFPMQVIHSGPVLRKSQILEHTANKLDSSRLACSYNLSHYPSWKLSPVCALHAPAHLGFPVPWCYVQTHNKT